MRKLLVLIICTLLCVSIISCKRNENMNSSSNNPTSSTNKSSDSSIGRYTVIEENSKPLESINIDDDQKAKIFECCYKSMCYNVYTGLTSSDIYKIAQFNEIRYAYDDGEGVYYYTKYSYRGNNVFVFFYKYKESTDDTLCLFDVIISNKRYSKNDFDKILVNKSDLSDVKEIDSTAGIKNSNIFNRKNFDTFSLHLTEKGIMYIGYGKKNIVKYKKELKGDWLKHFEFISKSDFQN